ncbi:response regulator [uncultured Thiodictyon sp.]|uniref:response regulator n=1 Tax=uncultured Thiodictyon sp. TaxID=1846217 RepID=UPI0025F4714A|nr:response regulator [uncultured Thiodictyon sp.]
MDDRARVCVVVIEDDPQIRRFLRTALGAEGMTVCECATGHAGLLEVSARQPDLVILDLGLPDLEGIEVIRGVRGWSGVPILVLSARTQETEKVAALDAGADDYLTKPFGVAELLARLRAHLRRRDLPREGADPQCRFGQVCIDFAARIVTRGGEPVHLTPIEYRLLTVLARNPGKVLTQRALLREVWGPGHSQDGHYLRIYMANLRRKLELDPARPAHLITETGVGYRLVTG